MTRAYAIAIAGGTQAIVAILASIAVGDIDTGGETVVVAVGFVVNAVAAELIILRRRVRRGRS
jgi:hypothetical protein